MSETTNNEQVKPNISTAKKVIGIVVNVLVGLILVLVLFISVNVIASRGKGYTTFFGTAFVAVESNSMVGVGPDNFEMGDLVIMNELDADEKNALQIGDIITFYDDINGQRELNTHRIVDISRTDGGSLITVRTKGDANPIEDPALRLADDIVGKYDGQIKGLGHFVLFFNSQWGFFTCIVVPAFLVVIACVLNLIKVLRDNRKLKTIEEDAEKEERIKAELLAQLAAQGILPKTEEVKAEPATEEVKPSEEKKD